MKKIRFLTIVSFVGLFVMVSGLIVFHNNTEAQTGQELVNIYADGENRTVATNAKTVGEALKRANIRLAKHDRSEPTTDSEITTDNFNVNIYRAQPVMIIDGKTIKTTVTSYKTPRQIVEHAGFKTNPADRFSQNITRDLLNHSFVGSQIKIHRAKIVNFDLYGTLAQVHTASPTVKALLKDQKIKLGKKDKISVPLSTPVKTGMVIDVSREGQSVKTHKEIVPFNEKQIQDVNRLIGYKKVQTPGHNGTKLVTYQTKLNGKRTAKTALQTLVINEPVQQVVVVGAKVKPTPATPKFTGDLSAAFAHLRACEAGGNYSTNTGNGYYGAYQYNEGTWANYGGYRLPSDAPAQVQDQKALMTYQARGWSPWPSCGAGL